MNNKYLRLNLGITKVYLIQCTEGYLLIDTGYESDYKKFIKELNKNNIKKKEIKYILLTHAHDDHAGFAQKLKEELNIPLIVQKKAVSLLSIGDNEAEKGYPVNNIIKLIMPLFMIIHKEFKYPSVHITKKDIIVNGDDNKLLRTIGIDGKILYTPGHTSDSMTVILDEGQTFCGDAAMNFLKFAGICYRPIYINDTQAVFNSWKKILKNGAKTIYPAHGNPFSSKKLKTSLKRFLN